MKGSGVHRVTTQVDDAGERLDVVIPRRCPSLSRSLVRKVIDLGGVHLDGRRIRRCGQLVTAGQSVELYLDGQPLEPWCLGREQILAEDRYLLVINKPAGIETQPTPARYKGTLYQALIAYLQQKSKKQKPELGMVQRLDRGTSGVMVFSIHQRAHRGLTAALSERRARKRYLALVQGVPSEQRGEIHSLLARNRASNLVRSVARGGKEAITRYQVLRAFEGFCLVEIELLTGRSHQIRAHFSEAGHPLLGDVRYGGPASLAGGELLHPLLHSWQLELPHPVGGEWRHFSVSPPAVWAEALAAAGVAADVLPRPEDSQLFDQSQVHFSPGADKTC